MTGREVTGLRDEDYDQLMFFLEAMSDQELAAIERALGL